jgi:hypothetical protein
METLSPENRAMLDLYKKERPDLFARLPLPKKLAEEYGVPISAETVHLMDFMKSHMSIVNGHYDEFEEKVACKVTDASGIEIQGEPKPETEMGKIWDFASKLQTRAHQIDNNKKAYSEFYKSQPEDLETESTSNITEGSTNAAAIPQ